MHPTDFSRGSSRAFATAIKLAKDSRSTLTLLHVIVPIVPLVPEQFLDTDTWARIDVQARRWGDARLRRLAERARKAGLRVTTMLFEGDPARHIVRAARAMHVDYLVLGTHGRTGWTKFLLGSVTERVIAAAPCPVLVVRRT